NHAGTSHRASFVGYLSCLLLGIRTGIRLSRRIGAGACHPAAGYASKKGPSWKRGNRGKPDRRISVRNAGRLEAAGPHSGSHVSRRPRRFEPALPRRSRAICTHFAGAFCGVEPRMSTIEVLAPGLLTTVQDLGREGFGPMGVSPSGAADAIALRIGN